jgi:hypothetical protein
MADGVSRIKTLVVLYTEDDEELKSFDINSLDRQPCDLCGKKDSDEMYVLRLDDGNIYTVCKKCFERLDF